MLTAAIDRALRLPVLEAASFTATRWDSADDKAVFGNKRLRFVAEDFPQSMFTENLYGRLSNTSGHIAHYDRHGFYGTFFTCPADKVQFLRDTLSSWPCGDPAWTFCDVERVVMRRLRESGVVRAYEAAHQRDVEQTERALLAKLQEKYAPVAPPAAIRRDLFDSI